MGVNPYESGSLYLRISAAALIYWLAINSASAANISGRVWHDVNCNGLQDITEPGVSNVIVIAWSEPFNTNLIISTTTDVHGAYSLTPTTSGTYYVGVVVPYEFRFTHPHIGDDDTIDSNFTTYGHLADTIAFSGAPVTHIDAGLCIRVPSFTLETRAGDAPPGNALYVTNGAWVTFQTAISNNGESFLSGIFVFDTINDDFIGYMGCPRILEPKAGGMVFTNRRAVYASETNVVEAFAEPVSHFCDTLMLHPVFEAAQTVVIVLSDELDDDGDGYTEWQEYLADTDPDDSESHFPNTSGKVREDNFIELIIPSTSTQRLYGIFQSTNLLMETESWNLITAPQAGTGNGITFIVTNNMPHAAFRSGVWPP